MSRQRNYAHATSGNALLRLATVEAGFPAGVELGGAQSGVTVCMCGVGVPRTATLRVHVWGG